MKWIAGAVLCFGFASGAFAQETRNWLATYQDWHVYAHRSGTFVAETRNDSGATFGAVCRISDGLCYWAIISNSRCMDDGTYPILVNAAAGSFGVNGHCFGAGQNFTMSLDQFDTLLEAISTGSRVGFAVPLESGLFHVTRFSLAGAVDATRHAANLATAARQDRMGDLVL